MTAEQLSDIRAQHAALLRSGYFESPHNEAPGRQRGKRQRAHRETRRRWRRILAGWLA